MTTTDIDKAAWARHMKGMHPHICWETDGVSACLKDNDHDGKHSWEQPLPPKKSRGKTPPKTWWERAGYLYGRCVDYPSDSWVIVSRTVTGNGRLSVCDQRSIFDSYCYADVGLAIDAATKWSGKGDPPDGWHRNIQTGRRRPDGDPAREFVAW